MKPMRHNRHLTPQANRSVQDRPDGFVLILIVLLIAVVGAEMFVLSGISNRMLFDSNTAHLEALERNLSAAGLGWARHAAKQNTEAFGRTVELDVTSIEASGAALSVTLGVPQDRTVQVQVNTMCSRGPRTLKRSHTYVLDFQPSGGK